MVTPIVGFCSCSMFCCALLNIHSSFAIILMGKRELVASLHLSSWCLVIVVWLFLAVPWVIIMLFYLIKKEKGKISFLFEFGYIIVRGWDKSPLPLCIFASNIPYMHKHLYCFTVVCHYIHVMNKFKGK